MVITSPVVAPVEKTFSPAILTAKRIFTGRITQETNIAAQVEPREISSDLLEKIPSASPGRIYELKKYLDSVNPGISDVDIFRNYEVTYQTVLNVAGAKYGCGVSDLANRFRQYGREIENYSHLNVLEEVYPSTLEKTIHFLRTEIETAKTDDLVKIANTIYNTFLLWNEAEKQEIVRINKKRTEARGIRPESLKDSFRKLKEEGVNPIEVQKIINNLALEIVLTAHPTEAKSEAEITCLQTISKLLSLKDTNPDLNQELPGLIYHLMDFTTPREKPPTVLDEVDRTLLFFDTLYEVVPKLEREFREAVDTYFPECKVSDELVLVKWSSWVGSDQDGHPGVTPEVRYATAKRQYNLVIEKYIESIDGLLADTCPQSQKLTLIKEKLINRLKEPASRGLNIHKDHFELISELSEILANNDIKDTDFESRVEDLKVRVKTFGFHLNQLDIREHSKKYEEAVSEVLLNIDANKVESPYARELILKLQRREINYCKKDKSEDTKLVLREEEKSEILTALIMQKNILGIKDLNFTTSTDRIVKTFSSIKQIQRDFSKGSANVHITSFTHDLSDILEPIFFAKEMELLDTRTNENGSQKLESMIYFMPLFETIDDLGNCSKTYKKLFHNLVYQEVLKSFEGFVRSFFGYSDGTKDGGHLAANATIWLAQYHAIQTFKQFGYELHEFFHGRGGSHGRGGGRTGEATFAQPVGSILGKLRVTRQGERLYYDFSIEGIAHRDLEAMLDAIIRASTLNGERKQMEEKYIGVLIKLKEIAFSKYRELYEDDKLVNLLVESTPFPYIGDSNIGSRPARRFQPGTPLNLEDLRAIPWVQAWNQKRKILTSWYGTGLAITEAVEQKVKTKDGIEITKELLQEMYDNFYFFRVLVEHSEMAIAKSSMITSEAYTSLINKGSPEEKLDRKITEEFYRTSETIKKITRREILGNRNAIRESIKERNPLTYPLNFIQVELIKRIKTEQAKGENADPVRIAKLKRGIVLTMNAVSAAIQETG